MTSTYVHTRHDLVGGLLGDQDSLGGGDAAGAGQAVRQGNRGLLQLLNATPRDLLE